MKISEYYHKKDEAIEIPNTLDSLVKQTIKEHHMKSTIKKITKWSTGIAALFAFVIMVNVSPVFADSLSNIPILGYIVQVTTFTHYERNDEQYDMNIEVPVIEVETTPTIGESDKSNSFDGIDKNGSEELKQVITALNEQYIAEGKQLYEEFEKDTQELDLAGGGHMGIASGYEIKTNDERFLSIGRYTVNTVGSSSTVMKYDTIDKKNALLVTLPALFKDDSYISILSDLIISQMISRTKEDDSLTYWYGDDEFSSFSSILEDQNFYINSEHQLVIAFDKYEIAPGYMGLQEFIISTEDIADILVNPDYLR